MIKFSSSQDTETVPFSEIFPGTAFVRADVRNPREVYIKTQHGEVAVGLRYGQQRNMGTHSRVIPVQCALHVTTPHGVTIEQ